MSINGYILSRSWFDFSFSNPEKIKPIHTAIYFFAIEHCNRLGWKDKFGFPSQMVMEAIGVKNWKTYSKALNELVDFGFIEMIEISKNQYSSNIISIQSAYLKNTKAHTKALDKALSKHSTKHIPKHCQSTVSIDKQYNNITNKQYNVDDENKKPTSSVFKSLENLKEDYLNNKDLVNSVLNLNKKFPINTKEELEKKLKEFNLHKLEITGKKIAEQQDYITHFRSWVMKNNKILISNRPDLSFRP